MQLLRDIISEFGGIAATHELSSSGATRANIASAMRAGAIVRARQGWYALPDLPHDCLQALRIGGRLTGLSAANHTRGPSGDKLWVPPHDQLHVSVPPNACRLRTRAHAHVRIADRPDPSACLHWNDHGGGQRLTVGVPQLLRDTISCHSVEAALTVTESALHTRTLRPAEWSRILGTLPRDIAAILGHAREVSESGTETLVRHRMRPFRLPMTQQVPISTVGRVDFRIGRRLIVEVDGFTYHSDPTRFEEDRRRDAVLSTLGYRVLRFSYNQVMFRWHEVQEAILAAVARGDHL